MSNDQHGALGADDLSVYLSSDASPSGRSGQTARTVPASELLPVVYEELRALARSRLAGARPGQTLQPTALVHEAYLRLVGREDPRWHGRAHFFGAAAQAMRNILVDHARRKSRRKHGGDQQRVELGGAVDAATEGAFELRSDPDELLALDSALDKLKADHQRPAAIVLFKHIAGLEDNLIAEILGVSIRTVERDWQFARAWLHRHVSRPSDGTGGSVASASPPTEGRDATF